MPDKEVLVVVEAKLNDLFIGRILSENDRTGVDVTENNSLAVLGILLLKAKNFAVGKVKLLARQEAAIIVDHKVEALVFLKLDIAVGYLTVEAEGLVAARSKRNCTVGRIFHGIGDLISALHQGVPYVKGKAVGVDGKSALVLGKSELNLGVGPRNQSKLLVSAEAVLQNSEVTTVVYHTVKATEGEKQNCASCPLAALVLPGTFLTVMNNASQLSAERIDLYSRIFIKNFVNHII